MLQPSPAPSPLILLPLELLPYIAVHLPYPDLLALRHSHPHFYYSPYLNTNTNIRLKVAWLIDRKDRGLALPEGSPSRGKSLILKTDREFCRSADGEVRRIMERRRAHRDCPAGSGECEVVRGERCRVRKRMRYRMVAWLSSHVSLEISVSTFVLGLAIIVYMVSRPGNGSSVLVQ